ncbi:MAG TPA: oligosaccharide flippase family protein [Bacillales bacterium]|nr:oligosaccharide flippase family protein [Bacillales bacterium]
MGILKPVNQSKELFKGAFILTIAALIVKILSAIYRIPFQNIVGDVGFYIYQQIYPFYGIAIVLATTGFPVVISKLYAELTGKGDTEGAKRLIFMSYIFLQLFGILCFTILYFGADQIALWMNDAKLAILLRVVSIVFLMFPFISVLRGYYQGSGNMVPTAVSQVLEQVMRVSTILLLAYLFTKKGYSLYLIGGGAMFGAITGSLVSAFILFTFLWIRKEWKMLKLNKNFIHKSLFSSSSIFKALFSQGLAICICGMLMIFIQLADSLNLYSLLVSSGVEKEWAKSLKGIYDRGQPLIQLGTVAATSISLSIVPLISSERFKKNPEFLHHKITLAMKISIVVGVGATAGLWAIIKPTNVMLFENASGSAMLGVLSMVILLNTVISTMVAIMQGLGSLKYPAVIIITGFPVKYALNLLLIPHFGTMGAAVSSVMTLAVLGVALSIKFKKIVTYPTYMLSFFKTVFLAALVMVVMLKGILFLTQFLDAVFTSSRFIAATQALSAVFIGGMIFVWLVIRGKVFPEEDLTLFPFGSKLALFLRQKDRSGNSGEKN